MPVIAAMRFMEKWREDSLKWGPDTSVRISFAITYQGQSHDGRKDDGIPCALI